MNKRKLEKYLGSAQVTFTCWPKKRKRNRGTAGVTDGRREGR